MVHLIVQASKYLMLMLMLIYTLQCFSVFRFAQEHPKYKKTYRCQRILMLLIHADAFLVLFLTSENIKMLGFYVMQLVLLAAILLLFRMFYKNASELLLNNMCMLMTVGLIILTRLDFEKAFRQFLFMTVGMALILLFPAIMQLGSFFRRLTWVYAILGIAALSVVAVAGTTSYGAKLSLAIAGISVQPSEFVKIIFVFFIASMLYRAQNIRQLLWTSAVSAIFVLILVASKDLGGALLYYFTYLAMIYVATKRLSYFCGGIAALAAAGVAGYYLFSHVQDRVIAWLDPVSVIDSAGYQVSQSLFAIGTGGWFGFGLNQGKPGKIPVVEKDFVFSAISEEMGGVFALCLLIVCVSCFLMIFNISMRLKDKFYRLVALGLGTTYALQVFLTVGGVTKFIPSTGVTLPLVSYGGSSLLSTMILFGIIQALYLMDARQRELEKEEAAALAAEAAGIPAANAKRTGTAKQSGKAESSTAKRRGTSGGANEREKAGAKQKKKQKS